MDQGLVYKIASTPAIYSPGVWEWFKVAKRTESKEWSFRFLAALTSERMSEEHMEAILKDKFVSRSEGELLIISILP